MESHEVAFGSGSSAYENKILDEALDADLDRPSASGSNDEWIRGDVAFAGEQLMQRNLTHANEVANPVIPRKSFYGTYVKRGIDIALSGIGLIITAPVNLVLGILTYKDVGSPIFFSQERTGKDLTSFRLVKFRNMTNDRDAQGNLLPPDQRITKFGQFVRSHSLDELLNFWSVFKGDMSLIGPRPLPVEFTAHMTERHKVRYAVRPGLECPQMSSVPEGIDPAHVRFENDIEYVENLSFKTDITQAFRLIAVVFKRGATSAYTGTDGHFIGYDHEGRAMSLGRLKDKATYDREVMGVNQ